MGVFGRKRQNGNEGNGGGVGGAGGGGSGGGGEGPPEWATFFESAAQYERFEGVVRRYFRERGESVLIQDGRVSGPTLGEMQLGLTNVGQMCAQSEEAEWPELVAHHFDLMRQAQSEVAVDAQRLELDDVRGQLAIRLYAEQDIAPFRDVSVVREDVPGLVSLLALDLPSAVQSVKREQIAHWGMSDEEVFEIARANLGGLIDAEPELVEIDASTSLWFAGGDSVYNSSILLRLADYPQFAGQHGLFVSAPTRHMVLALRFESAAALDSIGHLMGLTGHMEHEGPGSLSQRVWWHKDGRWIEIPWRSTEEGIAVEAPEEFVAVLEEIAGGGEA